MTRQDRRFTFSSRAGILLGGLTMVAIAIGGCGKPEAPQMPPPEVLVAPVTQRNVPVYSDWVGTIEGYVNAEIRPKVQGYLLT